MAAEGQDRTGYRGTKEASVVKRKVAFVAGKAIRETTVVRAPPSMGKGGEGANAASAAATDVARDVSHGLKSAARNESSTWR